MSKFIPFERTLTLNLVFLFCLLGSILFASVQVKSQQRSQAQALTQSDPGTKQSKHTAASS